MVVKFVDGVLRPGGLRLTRRLLDFCAFPSKSRIIDLGCGEGATVEYLLNTYDLQAVGVDLSAAALQAGQERCPRLQLIQADGKKLPFADEEFTGVLAECSLSVMEYGEEILREINRILTRGGKLAISDLYRKNREDTPAVWAIKGAGCISGAKSYVELTRILADNGFKITIWEDHSEYLKQFVGSYIMKYGSLDDFWQCKSVQNNNQQVGQETLKKSEIGYFLLVAEKIRGNKA